MRYQTSCSPCRTKQKNEYYETGIKFVSESKSLQFTINETKELLEWMGYDTSKNIHEQFIELVRKKYGRDLTETK